MPTMGSRSAPQRPRRRRLAPAACLLASGCAGLHVPTSPAPAGDHLVQGSQEMVLLAAALVLREDSIPVERVDVRRGEVSSGSFFAPVEWATQGAARRLQCWRWRKPVEPHWEGALVLQARVTV